MRKATDKIAYEKISRDYYTETYRCLRSAQSTVELVQVLEEFTIEVMNDLHLKDIVFKSRNLLLHCLMLVKYTMTAAPPADYDYITDMPSLDYMNSTSINTIKPKTAVLQV